MRGKLLSLLLLAGALAGCKNGPDVVYRPYPQILPQHIRKICVQPFINKTAYFGLEDRLTQAVINEFLKNGNYAVVPENQADGVVLGEVRRYILTPVQYDAAMVPTLYKLDILLKVQFYDRASNTYLWTEPALPGIQNYSASTLPGGMTEEQAREQIWQLLSRDIVRRTVEGFGTVTSESSRKGSFNQPPIGNSTGAVQGLAPSSGVNPSNNP